MPDLFPPRDHPDYDDALFDLTEELTGVPAALEVGVVMDVIVAACGWWDKGEDMYCTRVTCWHWVN
jgi:hypothetical protein